MLEPGDASRFLRDRSGDPDEAAAAALATELGRLPLALEQAAGDIAETGGLTLARYLALFRTRGRELLGRGRPAGRDDTVNTTWSLSLDRLTQPAGDCWYRAGPVPDYTPFGLTALVRPHGLRDKRSCRRLTSGSICAG